ncbi:methyl-CpG-binding domain protein 2 isoform X1 [Musca domestica]|uniref:Methyl-CpG-binding domain protein 2 isoform X1 n=1 Tax=Musca domestica TaxID=7370 RepID=A0ABM3VLL4_MUSDO|nr:methyl-CpG-binding domain protein 2 isoform X1 [Musca domestica]
MQLPPPSISLYRCLPGTSISASTAPVGCGIGGGTSSSTSSITIVPQPSTGHSLKRKHKSPLQSSASSTSYNILNSTTATTSSSLSSSSSATTSSNLSTSNLKQQQQLEFSRAMRTDASLVPPIRQTASIFKQPVTVVRNHEWNKVKHDTKQVAQDKPKQLFWEKRLENMRACHATGEEFDDIVLPKSIKPLGPNIHEQTVMQSLATALHVLNTPVTGQTATKTEFQKNATAYINPDQPLMQGVLISEDDIRRQEDRVNLARRKLQEALKA